MLYYNISFKIFLRIPLCPYFLKQKDQAPYYLHHSFQRLNTSHMIYNNLPFKQLLKLTPFTLFSPKCKGLCYGNLFLQLSTSYMIYYKIPFKHFINNPSWPVFSEMKGPVHYYYHVSFISMAVNTSYMTTMIYNPLLYIQSSNLIPFYPLSRT